MTSKSFVGDIGTRITLDCGTNISAASALSIEVRKPDGTATSWTATLSGTDSLYFDTVADTLDQAGDWRLQAKVVIGTGTWRGETVLLTVYPQFA
jgi:hypothetical protein